MSYHCQSSVCVEQARTAAVRGARPAAVGHALHGRSAQQSVTTVAGHQAARSQRAMVVPSSGGETRHLPIGQAQRVTPMWSCVKRTL